MPRSADGDSAADGIRLGGESTGRVRAGRFVLSVGAPAGTLVDAAEGPPADATGLRAALSAPPAPDALAGAEEALDEAASVTGRVERALELFTAVAQGRALDRGVLLKEADVLLAALERLDREGRYRDALRLARALTGLLALLARWVALVETIRIALRAARAVGDGGAVAWARHELGSLLLASEDASAARAELEEALRLREELGHEAGAAATRHNLAVLRGAFPGADGRGGWSRPLVAAAVVAAAILVGVGGLVLGMALTGDDGEEAADTTPPAVSFLAAPESPTEERSAAFAFEADEPVRTFRCRLDEGAFEECVSPQNLRGPLAPGDHVFAVRAVDFAGNVGAPAVHEWTIEAGEGPAAVIVDAPAELTRETTATFTIEAPGAIRLQCRLDDGEPRECPTLVAFEVDEGDHVFRVRGFDAAGVAGPRARHRWTVDTTPPEVSIDSVAVADDVESVEVAFSAETGSRVVCVLLAVQDEAEETVESRDECTTPARFENLVPNTFYLVRLTAVDPAGNATDPPAEEAFDTFVVDRR